MTDTVDVPAALLGIGLLGAVAMLVYRQACRWAPPYLIPPVRRRRVQWWLRWTGAVGGLCLAVAALGLVLLLTRTG